MRLAKHLLLFGQRSLNLTSRDAPRISQGGGEQKLQCIVASRRAKYQPYVSSLLFLQACSVLPHTLYISNTCCNNANSDSMTQMKSSDHLTPKSSCRPVCSVGPEGSPPPACAPVDITEMIFKTRPIMLKFAVKTSNLCIYERYRACALDVSSHFQIWTFGREGLIPIQRLVG